MRRLSSGTLTALFFYLVFAGLLLLIHFWPAKGLATSVPDQTTSYFAIHPNTANIISVWRKANQSWHNLIKTEAGFPNQLIQFEKEHYFEKVFQSHTIQWEYAQSRLVFPVASDESQLVRFAVAWKELMQQNGFETMSPRWGVTSGRLWLKLTAQAIVGDKMGTTTVPIEDIELVQPLRSNKRSGWNFGGLIPSPPPELKTPIPSVKPIPTLEPKATPVIEVSPKPTLPITTVIPTRKPQVTKPPISRPVLGNIRARVAIIIDDIGYERDAAEAFFKIPAKLTWAVLPFTPYGSQFLAAGKEHGFEVLLHLPLEPIDKSNNPGPGAIRSNWSEDEIIKQLDADLAFTPGVVGINNHMGSAGTSDSRLMDILMREIKKRSLFFVDSHTIASSIAPVYARKYGLPFAVNEIFIDDSKLIENKKRQFRELIRIALRGGTAIGIGHSRPGTAQALYEMLPEFEKAGIVIVPISQLLRTN